MLSDKINKIKFDNSNGASQIARNALGVLKYVVQTSNSTTISEFMDSFKEVGVRLFEARPNMASVQNLVAQTIYEVNTSEEQDLGAVRKYAVSRIDTLCQESVAAIKKSAQHAADLITDDACLVTCSYSSTVYEIIKLMKRQKKRFKVVIAESKTGKMRYGEILARSIEPINVDVKVFPDNELIDYVSEAYCVLVGADSLLCDGSVVNGFPSYDLAVAAKESAVPFYSVCETSKANTFSFLGKTVELKKGFDCVPSNLITGIVTENGILEIEKLVEVMREKSEYFAFLGIK